MATLVVDTGQTIVGIFSVEDGIYVPYMNDDIPTALRRIEAASEVVTYNGKLYHLRQLGKFAGLTGDLPLAGLHTDMRSICWSDRIFGSRLIQTYLMHFKNIPVFPNTYEGSNELDCHMTFELWRRWKQGSLWVLDGRVDDTKIYTRLPSKADAAFFGPVHALFPKQGG